MPTIEEMLRAAKAAGASDLHITVGVPPKIRVNVQLITMDYGKMLPGDTNALLDQIMNEKQRAKFEEVGEHDMSFSIPNLGRYRVNAYKQRGSVAIALRLDVPAECMKLVSALIVAVAIASPALKKWAAFQHQKAKSRGGKVC